MMTPSDKIIRLIKEGEHYDGCSSFKGFLKKSYFCDECNRGYDHEDILNHPCNGKWCPSCKRDGCPDYRTAKQPLGAGKFPKPTSLCQLCHRKFFGEDCYAHHLMRRSCNIQSVCDTNKKCPDCCDIYERDPKKKHGGNRKTSDHQCG